MKTFTFQTYGKGTKAFLDAFSAGLIRCTVLDVLKPGDGKSIAPSGLVRIRVDETRKGFRKGEILEHGSHSVVPRDRVYTRGYFYRINTQYAFA